MRSFKVAAFSEPLMAIEEPTPEPNATLVELREGKLVRRAVLTP